MPLRSAKRAAAAEGLQKTISPVQFAFFGFGSVVGTAWVLLSGGFLMEAGPGGTLIGIILGGAAMALIAAMYAELGSRFPQTGGEVTFISAVFGKQAGFLVGWLLTLAYLSNLVFEGVALGWLAETLWPALAGPELYTVFGQPIRLGGLLLALASSVTIAIVNYRGARSFVRFQNILTILFLAIVAATVCVEFAFGSTANMQPFWGAGDGGSWLTGVAWVFGAAPMILSGFQSVLHTIEERSPTTSKDTVVRLCVAAVGAAAFFYLLVMIATVQAAPWITLTSGGLAPIVAISGLPWSGALRIVFLLALIASLLKAWNAVFMTAVRLLFAQAREGMIPALLAQVNPERAAPGHAVIVVLMVNLVGVFLGKGLLEPIVNVMSVCIASIFALICAATLVMRGRDPRHAGFRAPGGTPAAATGVVAACVMATFALLQPAVTGEAAAFKWILLSVWGVIGFALYRMRNRQPVRVASPPRGAGP